MLYDGNNNRFPDFFDMFMKKDSVQEKCLQHVNIYVVKLEDENRCPVTKIIF